MKITITLSEISTQNEVAKILAALNVNSSTDVECEDVEEIAEIKKPKSKPKAKKAKVKAIGEDDLEEEEEEEEEEEMTFDDDGDEYSEVTHDDVVEAFEKLVKKIIKKSKSKAEGIKKARKTSTSILKALKVKSVDDIKDKDLDKALKLIGEAS